MNLWRSFIFATELETADLILSSHSFQIRAKLCLGSLAEKLVRGISVFTLLACLV
mgnify:CR=1 FL=1